MLDRMTGAIDVKRPERLAGAASGVDHHHVLVLGATSQDEDPAARLKLAGEITAL